MYFLLVSSQQTSGVPLCLAPVNRVWCCDHKYLQSDKYIYLLAFSRFFVSFSSLAFSSFSRVSFAFRFSLGNLPKIQTGIYRDLFSLLRRKYFSFTYVSFLFAFIVPLFYTEKGNCFSLTRFTTFYFLSLSDSNFPVYLSNVCNLVSFGSVFIIHIIHNPEGWKKEVFLQMMTCYHYIKVVILTILLHSSGNQNF